MIKDKLIKCIWEVKPQKQGPVTRNGRLDLKEENKPTPPKRKTRKALARYQYEMKTYYNNSNKWRSLQAYCKGMGFQFSIITEQQLRKLMDKVGGIS